MREHSIGCVSADCSFCSFSVKVKKAVFVSDDLYVCPSYPKKHKKIDARDCNVFKCCKVGSKYVLCENCNQSRN